MLSLVQAIDYLNIHDRLSTSARSVYDQIRSIVPVFEQDTLKYLEIKGIKDYLCTNLIDIIPD